MASDGSRAVGRTIGRFASRRSDVFRTVDRRQSSHAYSTALSTPPSQEGKNHHPRVPDAPLRHPYSPLERKRRHEDEAIATARIDRWGRVGRKREIHGNWARDAARRGAATPVCCCCRRREATGRGMGALAISFVFRVGFRRRSKITERRPSTASTRSYSAKLDELPGWTKPRPIRRSSATSSSRDSRIAASSISPTDPPTFQRPAMPFAWKRTSANARS